MVVFLEIPGLLKAKGTIEFWFKPSWDGADGNDYRLFDASLKPICFFITKGADHDDWNNNEFGMMSEDVADANLEVLIDPAGKIKKMNGFILLLLGNIMKERVEKRHIYILMGKSGPSKRTLAYTRSYIPSLDLVTKQAITFLTQTGLKV